MKFKILNPETLPVEFEAENREKAWEFLEGWLNNEVELKEEEKDAKTKR